jgi:hypothetical protein
MDYLQWIDDVSKAKKIYQVYLHKKGLKEGLKLDGNMLWRMNDTRKMGTVNWRKVA